MADYATLVNTATRTGVPLELVVGSRGDIYVSVPMNPPREVVVGRNHDMMPGESEFIAYLGFQDHDDFKDAVDEQRDVIRGRRDLRPAVRLLHEIFVNAEPALEAELVTIDGARAVAVDLSEYWPAHVVYVPERLIP